MSRRANARHQPRTTAPALGVRAARTTSELAGPETGQLARRVEPQPSRRAVPGTRSLHDSDFAGDRAERGRDRGHLYPARRLAAGHRAGRRAFAAAAATSVTGATRRWA